MRLCPQTEDCPVLEAFLRALGLRRPGGLVGLPGTNEGRPAGRPQAAAGSGALESRAFHTSESSPCDTASPAFACRLCPASSWALSSGFALELKSSLKLQGHEFLWACPKSVFLEDLQGGRVRTQPGPCPRRPLPGLLIKGYLSGRSGWKNSGKGSPCFGEQSSKVVGRGGNPKMSPCV